MSDVRLVETTVFKDKTKEPVKSEKKFASLRTLHAALDRYGMKNSLKCDLKNNKKCKIDFQDATTTLEIVVPIVLTDAK